MKIMILSLLLLTIGCSGTPVEPECEPVYRITLKNEDTIDATTLYKENGYWYIYNACTNADTVISHSDFSSVGKL